MDALKCLEIFKVIVFNRMKYVISTLLMNNDVCTWTKSFKFAILKNGCLQFIYSNN